MPGLVAVVSRSRPEQCESEVGLMTAAMRHETFYSTGTYFDRGAGVYVGWSCLPGSYGDCMPVTNATKDLILFFYGEHHSATDDAGVRTAASARALITLFERDRLAALAALNGWFHGVLIDRKRRDVLVFNDRYGMQRLHFYSERQGVLFASEAKCLLRIRPELRDLDPRGLGEFLSCGAVLENRTLFPNVRTLPGGSAWRFQDNGHLLMQRYFSPAEWESQEPLPPAQLERQLATLMPRITARYFSSSLPIGVSLTGGFDTRLIMANVPGDAGRRVAYTFGGPYRDCFDVRIARKVAAICGFSHEVLRLDRAFFASFPALAEKTVYLSDGQLSACNAYELYLNMLAREIAPLKITGSFGSEVMRGSRAFRATDAESPLYHDDFRRELRHARATFNQVSGGANLTFSVFKHAPWYYYNRLAIEQSQVVVRTPFMDNELVGLMYRSAGTCDRRDLTIRLIRGGNPALATLPTDTGNTWWGKERLLHFLFQADYCYKSGMPQWLEQLHYAVRPLRPERLLIGLHRFQHFRIWFREQLADYVRAVLLDPQTLQRPYFDARQVRHMVERHLKGDRNYTDDLERVLSVELLHRSLLKSPAAQPAEAAPTPVYLS